MFTFSFFTIENGNVCLLIRGDSVCRYVVSYGCCPILFMVIVKIILKIFRKRT